jgi:hypothetical protein
MTYDACFKNSAMGRRRAYRSKDSVDAGLGIPHPPSPNTQTHLDSPRAVPFPTPPAAAPASRPAGARSPSLHSRRRRRFVRGRHPSPAGCALAAVSPQQPAGPGTWLPPPQRGAAPRLGPLSTHPRWPAGEQKGRTATTTTTGNHTAAKKRKHQLQHESKRTHASHGGVQEFMSDH